MPIVPTRLKIVSLSMKGKVGVVGGGVGEGADCNRGSRVWRVERLLHVKDIVFIFCESVAAL